MSASVAKERLLWCVKGRRDGGYWVGQQQYATYRFLEDDKDYQLPAFWVSARWVYA